MKDINTDDQRKMNMNIPFKGEKVGHFFQCRPVLMNTFDGDTLLSNYLKRWIPAKVSPVVCDFSLF